MRKLAFVVVAFVLACGDSPPTPVSSKLKVEPAAVVLAPGAVQAFSVTPIATSVVWSVTEVGGGVINTTGLYTAPAASGGPYHVVATSGAVSGTATVTVSSLVAITATSPVDVAACDPIQLVATVTGSADTAVVWSMPDPTCGSVSATGTFTSVRGAGTCTVQAAAHADPGRTALVTVNVATERVISVAVTPATAALAPGAVQQFNAMVTTSCGTFPAGT